MALGVPIITSRVESEVVREAATDDLPPIELGCGDEGGEDGDEDGAMVSFIN